MDEIKRADILKSKDFRHWTKCMFAMNMTQRVLAEIIENAWDKYLSNTDKITPADLKLFLQCIKNNNIQNLCDRGENSICSHDLCQIILNKLKDICNSPRNYYEQGSEKTGVTRSTMLQKIENVPALQNEAEVASFPHQLAAEKSLSDFSFDLAKLFCNCDKEDKSKRDFSDCGFLEMIEMTQNCRLFSCSKAKDVYEKILFTRRQVVYSRKFMLTERDLRRHINNMTALCSSVGDGSADCMQIIKDIEQIETLNLEGTEFLHFARTCIDMNISAIKEDNTSREDSRFQNRLAENVMQIIVEILEDKEIEEQETMDVPGRPSALAVGSDSLTLVWEKPIKFDEQTDYYLISYKEKDQNKWTFYNCETDTNREKQHITNIKPSTEYVFRVKVVHQYDEGRYSQESEIIKTSSICTASLLNCSVLVQQGKPSPSIYKPPITVSHDVCSDVDKILRCEIGSRLPNITAEKTIMLVGATGAGKSRMVDGLVNYVLGVNWNDKFRFTIIGLEDEEGWKFKNMSVSQTELITVYTINPVQGGRLNYTLNIIDTPGFGDIRGIKWDEQIVEQIRSLFSGIGVKRVQCIDSICCVFKAPDRRLTALQSYICQVIMSLFGRDVEENICSLITFAYDDRDPPVLARLAASKIPFGKHFTFNNSCLFAKNIESDITWKSLSEICWEIGLSSFNNFFGHLATMQTKSLQMTKAVLDERKKLETTIQNLQPQVDSGLVKLDMLHEEIRIISQHKLDADANKNFEYEVGEIEHRIHELPQGKYATTCLLCYFTCHNNCDCANDYDNKNCSAIDRYGNCTRCPNKCTWSQHAKTSYIFEYVTVKQKKTYQAKFQDAEGKRLFHEQVAAKLEKDLKELQERIDCLMNTVKQCNERIGEIALRPNPLLMTEHIDLMIQSEQLEKREGHFQRIAILEEMKNRALTTKRAEKLFQGINQQIKTFSAKSEDGNGKTKKESKSSFSLKKFLEF